MKQREWEALWIARLEQALHTQVKWVDGTLAGQGTGRFQLPSKRVIEIEATLTKREEALVQLFLDELAEKWKEEGMTEEPGWIGWLKRLRVEGIEEDPPDEANRLDWADRVPFFLVVEETVEPAMSQELQTIVESYFEDQDVWVIPIQDKEWLILTPQFHLIEEEEEPLDVTEIWVQSAEGLAEAIMNESGQQVRIVIHQAISTPEEVKSMWMQLVNGYQLGKTFHPHDRVHLSGNLVLEDLLQHLGGEAVDAFFRHFEPPEMFQDEEMRKTVETFFRLDLNVSETARQLFVHRNTLLYRLERLKQETGLDVRRFEDAVIVKVALLLSMMRDRV